MSKAKTEALSKINKIAEEILVKIDDEEVKEKVRLIISISRYEHDVTGDTGK